MADNGLRINSALRRQTVFELQVGSPEPSRPKGLLCIQLVDWMTVSRIDVSMELGWEVRRIVASRNALMEAKSGTPDEWRALAVSLIRVDPCRAGAEQVVWGAFWELFVLPAYRGEDEGWFSRTFPELAPVYFRYEEKRLAEVAAEVLET